MITHNITCRSLGTFLWMKIVGVFVAIFIAHLGDFMQIPIGHPASWFINGAIYFLVFYPYTFFIKLKGVRDD